MYRKKMVIYISTAWSSQRKDCGTSSQVHIYTFLKTKLTEQLAIEIPVQNVSLQQWFQLFAMYNFGPLVKVWLVRI